MLLASLALAFLVSPQAQPKEPKETKEEVARKEKEEVAKVWDNLGVMRRLLTRQIGAHRDRICSNPAPKGEDGDARVDVVTKNGDGDESVARSYVDARNLTIFDSSIATDAEYAPGLAAVFSLTVPVKVELVESEPSKDDARKPSESKNADDEAWDKLARGDESVIDADARALRLLSRGGKAHNEPHRELRYDDAAVKALKETLFDTLARFGSKLGCGHGERIVVVARLTTGGVVNAPAAKGGDAPTEVTTLGDPFAWRGNRYPSMALYGTGSSASTRRIVIQMSADDVRAFKNGDLERDELLKKTRIDDFNSAAAPGGAIVNTTWGSAR
jgi:hypothetical protein